jgi:hypothetical protein
MPRRPKAGALCHDRLDTAGEPPWEVLVVSFANLLVASMGWAMGTTQEEVDLAKTPSALLF